MTTGRSNRREELMTAATRIAATKGLRGLTHRAVDTEAGVPQGSTSAYWRTRDALLGTLAEQLSLRLADDVKRAKEHIEARPQDIDNAVAQILALLDEWYDDTTFTAARLELRLAAHREPSVDEVLRPAHEQLIAVATDVIEQVGLDDPHSRAITLLDAVDGIVVGSLSRAGGSVGTADRRQVAASVRMIVHAVVPLHEAHATP